METNHTKGKWSINEWTQPDREISIGAIGTPLIAKVMLRDCSINEHRANAKLIAAAPDMFELLLAIGDDMITNKEVYANDVLYQRIRNTIKAVI
jgi:hypothetical protein